ncbi:hypothetical protein EST38_g3668 [Candolleomyces aberdarensis]|uniref:G domain-containing protein n=1 Tax=Candolleomyces aberdarensis TaxID=2316362 RepID=A0A4Q2DRI3_9AGAR|nr:hypothetical protein EST38_g3668 [Candolleomyces aberdarensis]
MAAGSLPNSGIPASNPAGAGVTNPGVSNSERKAINIMIPVIGPSGGGKSTFIKNVFESLGEDSQHITVDDGFGSCTLKLAAHSLYITDDVADQHNIPQGSRLVFVDTPGFDNPVIYDSEVVSLMANWLASE